jgi:trehalose 6-phosphate phosphatase
MVGVAGVAVVGEHGLELAPEAAAWADRVAEFARGVDWPAERKPLSVSFHFRRADDQDAARAYLTRVADAAEAEGLVPRWGRMVLEVRPPVAADKGTAVRTLVTRAGVRRALYAGDDRTDLDAFHGLEGLELGVRVAVGSAEAPPELLAAADLVVDGTDGVLGLLRRL